MKPYLKFGLLVGIVGFFLIIPVTVAVGICGPGVTLLAGAVAGFLAAYKGQARMSREGGQSGAIAGAIAGMIMLLGQLLGGVITLGYLHQTQAKVPFGGLPSLSAPLSELVGYYVGGLGFGLCLGVGGILLGAIAGGVAGALGARPSPRTGVASPESLPH